MTAIMSKRQNATNNVADLKPSTLTTIHEFRDTKCFKKKL